MLVQLSRYGTTHRHHCYSHSPAPLLQPLTGTIATATHRHHHYSHSPAPSLQPLTGTIARATHRHHYYSHSPAPLLQPLTGTIATATHRHHCYSHSLNWKSRSAHARTPWPPLLCARSPGMSRLLVRQSLFVILMSASRVWFRKPWATSGVPPWSSWNLPEPPPGSCWKLLVARSPRLQVAARTYK